MRAQTAPVPSAHPRSIERRSVGAGPRLAWRPRFPDPRVASTRIRYVNVLRELRRRGWSGEILAAREDADIVVYGKRYDDEAWREASDLRRAGARIVFDLCDNHFYNPNGLPELRAAPGQIHRMTEIADAVVVSTPALAEVLVGELGPGLPVRVIGDAVETEASPSIEPLWSLPWRRAGAAQAIRWSRRRAARGLRRLIWFGVHGGPNASYGMEDLLRIRSILEEAHRREPVSLTVVSNSRLAYHRTVADWALPTRYLEWSPLTFLSVLREHDLALLPVTVNPFTWAKSNNRLAQALSCEVAVAADSIPSYQEFGDVTLLGAWERFEEYLGDPGRRRADASRGRERVRERWSIGPVTDRWEALFVDLAEGGIRS